MDLIDKTKTYLTVTNIANAWLLIVVVGLFLLFFTRFSPILVLTPLFLLWFLLLCIDQKLFVINLILTFLSLIIALICLLFNFLFVSEAMFYAFFLHCVILILYQLITVLREN
ncbi:MAG: hypothetical protein AAB443_00920 [Patescibacteria group bacterium]